MAGGLRWTEEMLSEWQERARLRLPANAFVKPETCDGCAAGEVYEPDPGSESDLQDKIEKWCEDHGYPFFHDRSRKCNEPGLPDLVIALPGAVTLWVELKSKRGRLSEDQKRWRLMLLQLGHQWHEVRSYRQFIKIVGCRKDR